MSAYPANKGYRKRYRSLTSSIRRLIGEDTSVTLAGVDHAVSFVDWPALVREHDRDDDPDSYVQQICEYALFGEAMQRMAIDWGLLAIVGIPGDTNFEYQC